MTPVFASPRPEATPVAHRSGVPLRVRLVLGMLVLAAILIAPLVVTRYSLERLFQDIQQLESEDFRASLLFGRMRTTADLVRRTEFRIGGLKDGSDAPVLRMHLKELRSAMDSLTRLQPSAALSAVDSVVVEVERYTAQILVELDAGDFDKMDTISNDRLRPALQRLATAIETAETTLRRGTANRVRGARDDTARAQKVSLWLLGFALVFAAIVAAWIIVNIARPVADLEEGMARVASGQFDHELKVASRRTDEFGRLAESYAGMAQRLGELDRLKAEFVSMASHELKTPLNVILGYLTLLDDGQYGPLTDKQRDVIRTLERQSHSLNRLVRQLLDVSKFDAGGATLSVRPFPTATFFGELETSLSVIAQQRGVTLSVTCADGMPAEVWWDRDRMMEALGNLVTNACKFTPRDGIVALHGDGEPGIVRLEVRDTGVGIPSNELPHVFRKFFQARNQEGSGGAGAGLGLAIVRGIIEAHGGTVQVTSEVGVGTTFTIQLPQRAPTPRRVPAAPSEPVTPQSSAS